MKRVVSVFAIMLVALVMFTACESKNELPPIPDISFDIPTELQGVWENTIINDRMTLSENDIISSGTSMRSGLTALLESQRAYAQENDVSYEARFSQSTQGYGYYQFNLMIMVDSQVVMVTATFDLQDDGSLDVMIDLPDGPQNLTYKKAQM